MPFTNAQQWALVIVPKITGFLSLVSSFLVILTVLLSKERRTRTYHRLLLGISCVDVSSSFWLGLSTWPIPEETGILLATGNTASCTVQGFFTQFGIASSFYNASLSIFYLLVIRWGWKEERVLQVEPYLHGIPLLWALGTAIAGIPLTLFNSANLWCWIAPYQDRGQHADLFRWVFFYGPLWIMIGIVTVNLFLIFQHVRRIEQASYRYSCANIMRHFQEDDFQLRYSSRGDSGISSDFGCVESDGNIDPGEYTMLERMEREVGNDVKEELKQSEEEMEDEETVKNNEQDNNKHPIKNESVVGMASQEQLSSNKQVLEENRKNVDEGPRSVRGAQEISTISEVGTGESLKTKGQETQEQCKQSENDDAEQRSVQFALESTQSHSHDSTISGRRRSRLLVLSAASIRQSRTRSRNTIGMKRRSREVANQSLRFAGSFYFTWLALTLTRLLQAINGKTYFPLLIIAAATTPLQGLPNFLVYLAPRYLKARKAMPNAGAWAWLRSSIAPEGVSRGATSSIGR